MPSAVIEILVLNTDTATSHHFKQTTRGHDLRFHFSGSTTSINPNLHSKVSLFQKFIIEENALCVG